MLMEDVRTPVMEVARNVGISGAAIHQRLRKLEKAKLISESNLVVNPNDLGYDRNFISSEKIRRTFYRSLKH